VTETYEPSSARYAEMPYRRCGASGLMLPALSLGLWQNFGADKPLAVGDALCRAAFDNGITHFDLANNYGPPPGAAESAFGEILRTSFAGLRDELIIATKARLPDVARSLRRRRRPEVSAGQPGPEPAAHGARLCRYLLYSHRFDPDTPLEETMGALDTAVRSGRALYAGISSYSPERTAQAAQILRELGTPLLIHQPSYSMLNRWIEGGLLGVLASEGVGCIAFSPLAQGVLTGKYADGVPAGSRASKNSSLSTDQLSKQTLAHVGALAQIARARDQSLAQLALSWALRDQRITSVLIGASSVTQLEENIAAAGRSSFTDSELAEIDRHAVEAGINIWSASSEH
jgi:L-glyceraldehyde 3-phosphate reductase